MSWECPRNKPVAQRNANIVEAREESNEEEEEVNNPPEEGEYIMMKIILVKTYKKVHEPTQRKSLFRTKCKSQGKCHKTVINNGSTDHLVSSEMVEKLRLEMMKHPSPYKVSWLEKGNQLLVNE